MSDSKEKKFDYSWRKDGAVAVPDYEHLGYEKLWFGFDERGLKVLKMVDGGQAIEHKKLQIHIFPMTDMFLYLSYIHKYNVRKTSFVFDGNVVGEVGLDSSHGGFEPEKGPLPIEKVKVDILYDDDCLKFNVEGFIGLSERFPTFEKVPRYFSAEFSANETELLRSFKFENLAHGIFAKVRKCVQ